MKKSKAKSGTNGIFVSKHPDTDDILAGLYANLERFSFCIPFLNGILKRYRLYLNSDPKECCAKAMGCILKIYFTGALCFCIIFGFFPSWYTFIVSLYMAYFFAKEYVNSSVTGLELKFLKGFDAFLGIVRHQYYKNGSVKDALAVSEADVPRIMRGHVREMLRCMSSLDSASEINIFLNSSNHKYLKLFLTLVRFVEENGDVEDDKGSVFLNSCMQLKYDVEEDERFISEKRHRFKGLVYTAVLPVIAVPFIAMWGVSTIPSLNLFYNGYVGAAVKMILLIISFLCYNAVSALRDGAGHGKKKHPVSKILSENKILEKPAVILMNLNRKKQRRLAETLKKLCEDYSVKTLYTSKVLLFIGAFYVGIVILFMGHREAADIYRNDISEIDSLTQTADSRQIEAMEKLIPVFVSEILDRAIDISMEQLVTAFLEEKEIKSEAVAKAAAEEVLDRVENYRKETLNIIDIFLSFIAGCLGYFIPNLGLFFKKSLLEGSITDEVMQFQSIVHMLKKVPGVSVVMLLEEMERFSYVFKPSIRQCINEYSISDEEALKRLYDAEKTPEWRKLVDCFLMADELGIEDAFDEITLEIENYKENRKLDRKILMDQEVMLGSVISVLPGGLILFGFLLCPFMIRSMQIFNEYQAGITMNA